MSELENKVEKYKENLVRITDMKKAMIDAELSVISIKELLNLNYYAWKQLFRGELPEREKDVWEIINKTPEHIIKRDKTLKTFQKILLDKGIKAAEIARDLGVKSDRIYRTVKKFNLNRDRELERKIEEYLGERFFD